MSEKMKETNVNGEVDIRLFCILSYIMSCCSFRGKRFFQSYLLALYEALSLMRLIQSRYPPVALGTGGVVNTLDFNHSV